MVNQIGSNEQGMRTTCELQEAFQAGSQFVRIPNVENVQFESRNESYKLATEASISSTNAKIKRFRFSSTQTDTPKWNP